MDIDPTQIVVSLMVFSSVFMLIWSLFRFPVTTEMPVHRRIAAALGLAKRETVFEQPVMMPVMNLSLAVANRFGFPAMREWLRRKLNASGNPNGYSIDEFLAICIACGVGVMFGTLAVTLIMFAWFDPIVAVVMLFLGFGIPLWTLHEASVARIARISKKLPYSLDLIALMMAAGSAFTEAIDTLIRDEPEDDLNQELRIVMAEIEFGTRRGEALRNLAERIPLETLRSIVGAINQAEAMGTPLSDILKSQSGMIRMHRSVRAEKLSASASLRILLPTMVILLAAVFALFGPLIVKRMTSGTWFS
jgi:tight adherence protein C